jgi:hypothetical protein
VVPKVDKLDLNSVTWSQISFRFFETFCEYAPWNKLCGSTNFINMNLKIKSYGEMKILKEVWVGLASVVANEEEFTKVPENEGWRRKKEFGKKEENNPRRGRWQPLDATPCPGPDRWLQ